MPRLTEAFKRDSHWNWNWKFQFETVWKLKFRGKCRNFSSKRNFVFANVRHSVRRSVRIIRSKRFKAIWNRSKALRKLSNTNAILSGYKRAVDCKTLVASGWSCIRWLATRHPLKFVQHCWINTLQSIGIYNVVQSRFYIVDAHMSEHRKSSGQTVKSSLKSSVLWPNCHSLTSLTLISTRSFKLKISNDYLHALCICNFAPLIKMLLIIPTGHSAWFVGI